MNILQVYECSSREKHRLVRETNDDAIRTDFICGRCGGLSTFHFIGQTSQAEGESESHARYRAALTQFEEKMVS